MKSIAELLQNMDGFVIEGGIPRQQSLCSSSQKQTMETFGFKWGKRDTYESEAVKSASKKWLEERYGMDNPTLREIVKGKRVLDAGCGSAYSALLLFGEWLHEFDYIGVDISNAVDVARQRFRERNLPGQFAQISLMNLPKELMNFDVIFSEGVLHHTDSTRDAIRYLSTRLNPQGFFLFYVYNKKGPIREFTDDYIRAQLKDFSDEQAWKALEPLTKLGQQLGELNIELDIKDPIALLNIPSGKIDLQRFFYWHIFKAFYRPDWSLDEMNHVNFDWYRPQNCHRQTPDEVVSWVEESGLQIRKIHCEEAGITVVAQKI